MGLFSKYFVEVKNGTKVVFSETDLRKLDRTYEGEVVKSVSRRVRTPFRKVSQQAYLAQIRDYAFEQILDKHLYTFQHLLVIPNPYDLVKQSALILFNSSQETKVRYRVIGDTPEADFRGETDFATRHRVPVMGLYLERSNQVELELIDRENMVIKHRVIRIYVSETPKNIQDIIGEASNKKLPYFPFILINGVVFNPIVFDSNGAIRYSIQLRTSGRGMIPIGEGRFLYEDRTASRMMVNGRLRACRYHEMDYMGRVYRTFYFDFLVEGLVARAGESIFFITASGKGYRGDKIIEVNASDGRVVKSLLLSELFGDTYQKKGNWSQITCMECQGRSLIITAKSLHTIFKVDWETGELQWVFASEYLWKGTPAEPYVLKGDVPTDKLCMQPDFAAITTSDDGRERLVLFQRKSVGEIKLPDMADADKSAVVFVELDTENRTFHKIADVSVEKTEKYGSVMMSPEEKELLLCLGRLEEDLDERRAAVELVDRASGAVLGRVDLKRRFNKAWVFEPDIGQFAKPLPVTQDVVFGKLNPPKVFDGELPPLSDEPVNREYYGATRLCGDILQCSILPGSIDRIYFVGKKHKYVQDYSKMESRKRKFPLAIALGELKADEYRVYIEYENEVHLLKNEIRIIGKEQ